ncbi:MAG: exo-beta-N-acetylmuramidase NamZ domain-containing protein [Flavobacteriaceae bacterium]
MIALLKNTAFFVFVVCSMPLFAQVQPGAYQTQKYIPLLINMKVAVVGNQSSQVLTNDKRIHLVDHLRSQGVNIIKVFAPEHGFRGKEDAGASISNEIDTKTGIPIVSLHGKYRKPPAEQLADVDILVFDIQDVGVRFFTYLSTLHLVMEACADSKVPVIVLDRPNPNAHYVDGPMMEEENQSFFG